MSGSRIEVQLCCWASLATAERSSSEPLHADTKKSTLVCVPNGIGWRSPANPAVSKRAAAPTEAQTSSARMNASIASGPALVALPFILVQAWRELFDEEQGAWDQTFSGREATKKRMR